MRTLPTTLGIFKMVQSHSPKRPMAQWSSLEHQSRYGSSSYKWTYITYITSYNHSSRDECPMKPPFIVDFPMVFPWFSPHFPNDFPIRCSQGAAGHLRRSFQREGIRAAWQSLKRQADAVRTYFTGIRLQNVFFVLYHIMIDTYIIYNVLVLIYIYIYSYWLYIYNILHNIL